MPICTEKSFLEAVAHELRRAERYRIFISLVTIDLGELLGSLGQAAESSDKMLTAVSDNLRAIDQVAMLEGGRLAMLLPETSRQGAQAASQRITALLREAHTAGDQPDLLPCETVSYPDAAGTRTITDFMKDLTTLAI